MTRPARRTHSPAFNVSVALAALEGEKTLVEVAQQFDMHPNQVTARKAQLAGNAAGVFSSDSAGRSAVDLKVLHAKIGELTLTNDFLCGAIAKASLLSAN